MIGVEFVKDRETREPDGDLGDALIAALRRARACCCSPAGPTTTSSAGSRRSTSTGAEIEEALGIFQEVLLATQ